MLGTASQSVTIPGRVLLSQNNIVKRKITTSFNIPTITATTILWNTDDNPSQTTGITYSAGVFTNSNSFAINVSITGFFGFGINENGVSMREISIVISGISPNSSIILHTSNVNQEIAMNFSRIETLPAGATFYIYAWHNSGLNLTYSSGRLNNISILVF